jgi:hypothetical protein
MVVAVEVPSADLLPTRPGLAPTAPLIRSVPFISQIATFPLVFCNRAVPKTPPIGVTLVDELLGVLFSSCNQGSGGLQAAHG